MSALPELPDRIRCPACRGSRTGHDGLACRLCQGGRCRVLESSTVVVGGVPSSGHSTPCIYVEAT